MQRKNIEAIDHQANQAKDKLVKKAVQSTNDDKRVSILLQPYLSQTQMSAVWFISICNFLYTLPCPIYYIIFAYQAQLTASQLQNIINRLRTYETSIMSITLAIKFIIFYTLYLDYKIIRASQHHRLLIILAERLNRYFRCIIQIDLLLSVFFLCTQTVFSCINFGISLSIIILSVLFLQNYCNNKDLFFIGSVKFYVLFRTKIIISSLVSYICGNYKETSLSLGVFVLAHSILAIITVISYVSQGFIVYRTAVLKQTIFASVSAYSSITIVILIDTVSRKGTSIIISSFMLTFFIIYCYLSQHVKRIKLKKIHQQLNIEGQATCFLYILQQLRNEPEVQLLVKGLISLTNCIDPKYRKHLSRDNKTRKYHSIEKDSQDIVDLAESYIKYKYELLLGQQPTNINAIFNYTQFIYNSMGNTASSIYWLNKIGPNNPQLNFSNKIKYNRLMHKIHQENRQFSHQALGNDFNFEDLTKAQMVKTDIMTNTVGLLYQKMKVLKMLENAQIDMSQLRQNIQLIRKGIINSSKSWNSISSFVQKQLNWKIQYSSFLLFLRNEKLSSKYLQDLRMDFQAIQNYHHQPLRVKGKMFDMNSCCIHTVIKEGRILITKASTNSTRLTGYSSAQLENVSLNILVPPLLADKHHQMIVNRSINGICSMDNSKTFSQVYLMSKQGFIVPVQKCFKQYVSEVGELEYVLYLKIINQHESVFLCNQNFQIVGCTSKCNSILSENSCGKFIKQFNLLSFIPELAQHKASIARKQIAESGSYQANSMQFQDRSDHFQFNFSRTSLQLYQDFDLFFPKQPHQNYISLQNRSQIQSLDEQTRRIAREITNRPHLNIICQLDLNCYSSSIGLIYHEVKLKKIRHQALENPSQPNQQLQLDKSLHIPAQTNKSQLDISKISSKSNIYIKQQANEAPKDNIYLIYIKYLWLTLFTCIFIFSILNMNLFQEQFGNMAVSINNIYVANKLLLSMSKLINLYIAKILNIPSQITIPQATELFQGFLNNPQMHQAFFKQTINPPAMYFAASDYTQNGTSYNQIDFLFFSQSFFRTLSLPEQVMIGSSSYNLVMDFQYPALNDFLNLTNINLSTEFIGYENTLKLQYAIVFSLEMVLIAILSMLILFYSFKFYGSMLQMVKVHCRFTPQDISKSIRHLKKVVLMFQQLQKTESQQYPVGMLYRQTSNQQKVEQNADKFASNNLNKRSKNISKGKQLKRNTIIYFVKIIACFITFTTICLSRNLYFMSLIYPAKYQMVEGQNFLNSIPTHHLTAQIIANAFSTTVVPGFYQQRYQPLISNLYILMNMPYEAISQADDAFSQLTNQFYFTNACQISIQALRANNMTLKQCQSVANYSLKGGLRLYSRYQYRLIQDIFNKAYSPGFSQVQEYFRSIDIYNTINNFVIDSWVNNYNKLTLNTSANIQMFTLLACLSVFLMFLLFQRHIFRHLKSEYQFYQFFYATMMPQEIISGEKIVRSKLTEIKFL